MRQLNGTYTQRFNRRHGRVGYVFQGRFKAILVERESYLLELCRYVVLNPLRAKMVEGPAGLRMEQLSCDGRYSTCAGWLYTDWLLSQFGESRTVARERYAAFVAEGLGDTSPWPALKGQVLLGSEHFVESLLPLLEKKSDLKEVPKAQRLANRPELKAIFIPEARANKKARDSAIRKAYIEFGYSMAAIAKEPEIHYQL